ncbi:MAG: hypothetical protein ACD_16C00192G0018 [uncultured bacterium]|nr:MAG: hypothetical protein ACD_16C00192G0018 [uncultured bacterium]OFW68172.1 MAG: hypothetical protein A2X70_05705 [Alphaproteobacteria bacterium GWC2_42_16]OFW73565.1 MAG: hypothetical protein A2Z80_07005 [Alphaproteobacteria bacterium GWA2_41_27]OFW82414.1 MAG: hypothetical protein A3E50_04405 [Alphaproteobacteria bacterium RIFCSPHIGHO2_12_FULL_42_100]OFW86238.1 MAG: hypothetical protein A2W06_01335 [Alphaproteobacteria bacterium RBG_16_42_14]OFW91798.1 MAG: hypothetical protein A3C41_013
MRPWTLYLSFACLVFLSGCASDIISPPHTEHPKLITAQMARSRGDVPEAIHDFREVIKEDVLCEPAYIGLGFSLLDVNAIPESKLTFEKAITLFPKSSDAYVGLGMVHLVMDQPENALEAFEKALCKNPHSARALNGYGIALDMLGDHELAQANYRAAMDLDPLAISYESNLALSMALAGHEAEAIRILERLVCSPNATPRVRQNLALAYGLAGDTNMAKKIGRMDLSDDMVANNVAYMEAIRETKNYAGIIPKNHTVPLDETRPWQESD